MKKYLSLLFLIYLQYGFSQDDVNLLIDSLNFVKTHQEKSKLSQKIAFKLKDSDWKRTLKYLNNSQIEARKSVNKNLNLAIHYENTADIYYFKEVLDVALEYYQNAYNFYLETHDVVKIHKLENDLAIIYARLNNKRKAIFYFNKIYSYQVKAKDSTELVKVLNNLGTLYLKNNLDSSEYYYKKAFTISEKINDNKLNAYVYTNLGRIYLNKNNLNKSKYYFNKSKFLASKKLNNDLKSFIYHSISQYYFNLKQYDSAIFYSNHSKLLIHNKKSFLYLDNLKTLYKSNLARGFYKKASTYFESYDMMRDSINVEDKLVNIERLKLKQEYKLKSQLQKIKEDKRKSNYYLIGLSLVIGLLTLTIILIQYRNKLLKSKLEKESIESKRKELNLKLALNEKLLIAKSMSEIHQNEVIKDITKDLLLIKKNALKKETKIAIDYISKRIKRDTTNKTWEEFELTFKQVHKSFYKNLYKEYPNLTSRDKRLCALLILNLSSKEIAQITGETFKTVENARTRLRKKLNITNTKANLTNFLSQFI